MTKENPIEATLHLQFQEEKLSRIIKECQDISVLKAIALELLKLQQKKTTISQLAERMAAEAEAQSSSEKAKQPDNAD